MPVGEQPGASRLKASRKAGAGTGFVALRRCVHNQAETIISLHQRLNVASFVAMQTLLACWYPTALLVLTDREAVGRLGRLLP